MSMIRSIQSAFEVVAGEITEIQTVLKNNGTPVPQQTAYQFPLSPVELLPPDPAQPLPESLKLTYEANALSASTPVDLLLSCYELNNFDLALTNQLDLHTDNLLNTAIIISLFTDRYDPETNQGGYWGDSTASVRMGSRLWKLQQAKVSSDTLRAAEDYAKESLQWLLDDSLAVRVHCIASWLYQDKKNLLNVAVTVVLPDGSLFGSEHYQGEFIVAHY